MALGARLVLGILAAGMLGAAACSTVSQDSWTAAAQDWMDGYDAAVDEGQLRQELYYARDAVYDAMMVRGRTYVIEGRDPLVRLSRTASAAEITRGALYLGPRDAVRSVSWDYGDYGVDDALVHLQIGADGIERETLLAPTWTSTTIAHGQLDAIAGAETVAAHYLQVWSAGRPDLVPDRYAPEATLADALLGVAAQGRDAIAELAAQSAPITAEPITEVLPERDRQEMNRPADAAAVFFDISLDAPRQPTQVWLAIRSDAPCAGSSIVALDLDDTQRVARERRFHSAESLAGCAASADPALAWWTGREQPLPFGQRITGSLDTEAGVIEIRNGSERTDALVRWAFGQFSRAGLPAPAISSISFDPFDQRCATRPGYADWSDGTTEILMCFDPSALRPAQPDTVPPKGHIVLHELGHAWVVDHPDGPTRQAFMELVGAATWNDKEEPWRERGAEWAAETLSWGLKGSGGTSVPLGMPACALLAEGFGILTGADPLTSCPITPAP